MHFMPYFTIPKSDNFLSADLKLEDDSRRSLEIGMAESKKNQEYQQSYIGVLDLKTNNLYLYPTYEVDDPSKENNSKAFGDRYVVGHTKIHVEVANKVFSESNAEIARSNGYLMGFALTIEKKLDEKESKITFNGISRSLNSQSFKASEDYEKYAELKVNELVGQDSKTFPLGNVVVNSTTGVQDKKVDPRAFLPTPVLEKISASIHKESGIPAPAEGLVENLPPIPKSYYAIEREFINDEKSCKNLVEMSTKIAILMHDIEENTKSNKALLKSIDQMFGPGRTRIELLNARDSRGRTILMVAAEKGNFDIVKKIFSKVDPKDMHQLLTAKNFNQKCVLDYVSMSYYGNRISSFLKMKEQSLERAKILEEKSPVRSDDRVKEIETKDEETISVMTRKLVELGEMERNPNISKKTKMTVKTYIDAIEEYLYKNIYKNESFVELCEKLSLAYATLNKDQPRFGVFKVITIKQNELNSLSNIKDDILKLTPPKEDLRLGKS